MYLMCFKQYTSMSVCAVCCAANIKSSQRGALAFLFSGYKESKSLDFSCYYILFENNGTAFTLVLYATEMCLMLGAWLHGVEKKNPHIYALFSSKKKFLLHI